MFQNNTKIIMDNMDNITNLDEYFKNQNYVSFINVSHVALTTLQNYFELGKLANTHNKLANGYSKVTHIIEKILMYEKITNNSEINSKLIDSIINQMEFLQQDSPIIPDKIWNKNKKELKNIISVIINNNLIDEIQSVSSRNDRNNSQDSPIEIVYDNSNQKTTQQVQPTTKQPITKPPIQSTTQQVQSTTKPSVQSTIQPVQSTTKPSVQSTNQSTKSSTQTNNK
jgi:hypothetical protein